MKHTPASHVLPRIMTAVATLQKANDKFILIPQPHVCTSGCVFAMTEKTSSVSNVFLS